MAEVMSVDIAAGQLELLEGICKLRPTPHSIAELAAVYFTLGQTEKAAGLSLYVWNQIKDQSVGTNLAVILKDLGRHSESFRVIEEAYWMNPDERYTQLAYAEALLRAGFWKQAWLIYDNARPTQQGAALDVGVPNAVKEWQGEPLPKDHKLLVINEGGTGDRLSYARWLPKLTEMGINWFFYPYDTLHSLFTRVLPNERIMGNGTEIEPTHWCTTFSLPAKLGVGPQEIPEPLHFMPTDEMANYYKFNRADNLPIVGLCFKAAELHQGGRTVRSMSEGQAMRLVCQTGDRVHWVSLQHKYQMPYPVTTLPFETWEHTAGLLYNLDAVVTVDTGVFWLASSMKKPTALLLPGNSDWKFLTKGTKTSWSDSVHVYRNENLGFENAINNIVKDIRGGMWPAKF